MRCEGEDGEVCGEVKEGAQESDHGGISRSRGFNARGPWGQEARVPTGLSYRVNKSEITSDNGKIQARQHEKKVVSRK